MPGIFRRMIYNRYTYGIQSAVIHMYKYGVLNLLYKFGMHKKIVDYNNCSPFKHREKWKEFFGFNTESFIQMLIKYDTIVFEPYEVLITDIIYNNSDYTVNDVIPRRDMLEIYNILMSKGKKIFIKSEDEETCRKLLLCCGYENISFFKKQNDNGNTVFITGGDNGDIVIPSTYEMFKTSEFYNIFKRYNNDNRLMLGFIVNNGLFNSPFCQNNKGEPSISNPFDVGYIVFGPLLLAFTEFIVKKAESCNELWFLAREGYLLKKLYEKYTGILDIEKKSCRYFLASRKAVSFASVRDEYDIREIMTQYYNGSLSNVVKSRLGVDIDTENVRISLPEDIDMVMNRIRPYINKIAGLAKAEKRGYLKYIGDYSRNITVIDVGYMGTIQYYLTRLLNKKIDGIYLCTHYNAKPLKQGCKCKGLTAVCNPLEERKNKVFKNQLYLEAVLKAPFGQLLYFDENGSPVFNEDNTVTKEISDIQDGILKFVTDYAIAIKNKNYKFNLKSDLYIEIFNVYINSDIIDRGIIESLYVNDDYCADGNQKFNMEKNKWDIL